MEKTAKYGILILLMMVFQTAARSQTAQRNQESPSVFVGVKGGLNLPKMMYWHNPAMDSVAYDTVFKPIGGVFVEFPIGRFVTVAPEAMFVQRGGTMRYQHISGANVSYEMDVRYVDLRLPFEARWPIVKAFQPYLTFGAEAGMRLGGSIAMKRTAPALFDQSIEVGKANMSLIYAGAFAGLGFRSVFEVGRRDMMLKLAATYHQGLIDTYSKMEKDGDAIPQNVNAYQITGSRLPQGIELTLGIGISLNRRDDACSTFSNDRYRRKGGRGRLFGF